MATGTTEVRAEGDDVKGTEATRAATLVRLTPGTQVNGPRDVPAGWTHLVIKSVPRLTSGDLASLPGIARRTATRFRTVILAEVRPSGERTARFVLRRLGIGLCTPIDGVDTVVSSATVDALHAPLGIVERVVLEKAEEELMRGGIRARTPTFALYSAPTLQKQGSGHEPVLLRYAFLVDPVAGSLHTFVWSQASDPARRTAPERLILMPPGLVNDSQVDVLAERVLNTVAVNWSFALAALPTGTAIPTSAVVRSAALRETFTPAEAAAFEAELRALLSGTSGR